MALPSAWNLLIETHNNDIIQIVKKCLPTELDISNDEILGFLRKFKTSDDEPVNAKFKTKPIKKALSFLDDWERLLTS